MKRFFVTAVALSAFVVGPAIAADLGRPAPTYKAPLPPPPVYSWTGCWVGAGGGYSLWDQRYGVSGPDFAPSVSDVSAGGKGWFGTVGVGCDYQFAGSWLVGAFGDFDFSSVSGTPLLPINGGVFGNEKEDRAWAAGLRLGYLITPTVLTFVSAGWTEKHFKAFGLSFINGGVKDDSVGSHTYGGWFLGSGYETSLASWGLPQLTWKTEYRYASTNTWNTCLVPGADGPDGDECNIHFKKYQQSIRSELVWHFNWGGWGKGVRASY